MTKFDGFEPQVRDWFRRLESERPEHVRSTRSGVLTADRVVGAETGSCPPPLYATAGAAGRRPRVNGIGLETLRMVPDARGIRVDAHLRVGGRLGAIGDVTGLWPLTRVGKYQARIIAANILGEPREAHDDALPRVTFTDPQAAAVGATEDRFPATVRLAEVAKTATYTRAYAECNGYRTLLSDGERLRIPLDTLRDTIQPFPTFSEIYLGGLKALNSEIATVRVAEVVS